jgi:hypothetical protein
MSRSPLAPGHSGGPLADAQSSPASPGQVARLRNGTPMVSGTSLQYATSSALLRCPELMRP